MANATIFVLVEDGEVVAFYDLRDREDYVELVRMLQRVDLIGSGCGGVFGSIVSSRQVSMPTAC